MVIQRKNRNKNPPTDPANPPLVEHLVQKSLEVNPSLRQRRSTAEVMADLKKQAQPPGQTPAPAEDAAAPPAEKGVEAPLSPEQVASRVAAKRKVTVTYYLEQKADDYQRRAKLLQEREAQLQAERLALQQEMLNEVVDFFTVVTFGARASEAQEALSAATEHLQKLNITPAQLLHGLKSLG